MGRSRHQGFSVLELMVVLAIAAVLSAAAVPRIQQWAANQRLKQATRSLADLMRVAQAEAVRTGSNFLVLLGTDATGAPLPPNGAGMPYAAVAVQENAADGLIGAGERLIPVEPANGVFWGITGAGVAHPDDSSPRAGDFATGTTFQDALGNAANWLVFRPDGLPVAFSTGPYQEGGVGTGAGAVYVTNGARDYAIVLSPLGGVRVSAWDASQNQWR